MHKRAAARKSFLGPTVFTILGAALLLALGTWQVQRLHWKTALIAERTAGMAAPPVPLPRAPDRAGPLEYRHVEASGHYEGPEFYVHAIALDGAAGYHVVAPFALDGGGGVLVDRGFVPGEGAPEMRPPAPAGDVEVTGVLRLPAKPSWFTPDNVPATGTWFYVDPGAMAKVAGGAGLLPFYIDADRAAGPASYPVGGQAQVDLPNHHLQYAITWYALAAALVIVYILLLRKRQREAT